MIEMNYTQVSNEFIEKMGELSGNAVKVFLAISRKTIGWHKTSDRISNSQLIEMTGIVSRHTLKKAINELLEKGFIIQNLSSRGYVYDLNIKEGGQKLPLGGAKIAPKGGQKLPPQKKDKETIQKKKTQNLTDAKNNVKINEKSIQYQNLTNQLKLNIDEMFGNSKMTDRKSWLDNTYNEIRKLIEIDKMTVAQVREIISYLPYNDFWKKNILSGKKLRQHFYRLLLEFKAKGKIIEPINFDDYKEAIK